jgi:hypothetical protein
MLSSLSNYKPLLGNRKVQSKQFRLLQKAYLYQWYHMFNLMVSGRSIFYFTSSANEYKDRWVKRKRRKHIFQPRNKQLFLLKTRYMMEWRTYNTRARSGMREVSVF